MKDFKLRVWKNRNGSGVMLYLVGILRFGPGWENGESARKLYQLFFSGGGFMVVRADDIELMLYTGQQDKNGQEIWEGDIVKYMFDYDDPQAKRKAEEYVGWIQWDEEHAGWVIGPERWVFNCGDFCQIEVIGNRFEHPGLLPEQSVTN